jgi:DNA modification methylase
MAHVSENSRKLLLTCSTVSELNQLSSLKYRTAKVFFFVLPFGRASYDAEIGHDHLKFLTEFCDQIREDSTVCILTSPPDGASLISVIGDVMKFRHWIVVKTVRNTTEYTKGTLPKSHAALLIFTKYSSGLKHTKTRIRYTYCPACGKTTKDYGGKKHLYHADGTAISDVWRDVEWDPQRGIENIADRLRDFFGLKPYREMRLLDFRECSELQPRHVPQKGRSASVITANLRNGRKLPSKLIHGDCIDALKSIPNDSVDFCFADLPYNLRKRYYRWKDDIKTVEYFAWCDRWLSELFRVLKPGCTLAVLNIPLWAARHYEYLSSIMNFQNWIAWDALSFPVRKIMPAHYGILCFSKGSARPLPGLSLPRPEDAVYLSSKRESFCNRQSCVTSRRENGIADRTALDDLWHDVYRLMHNSQRVSHPCQLPPLLMRRLYALFTYETELILDCFNGAGTSTLVAEQMHRRFIGIEISKRFHNLSAKRHRQLARGEDPFSRQSSIPRVKNSSVQRLPKQKYEISKKTLQLEIKRIANRIGRLPTYRDVVDHSTHPAEYFRNYFVSWGEVCAAARTTGMAETRAQSEKHPSINLRG